MRPFRYEFGFLKEAQLNKEITENLPPWTLIDLDLAEIVKHLIAFFVEGYS